MKQKLYALDAFFIEKLKLSENYPIVEEGDTTLTGILQQKFQGFF